MRTEKSTLVAVVSVLFTLLLATGAPAGQSECDKLASLPINNTTITSTEYVLPAGSMLGYCEVKATVLPETDVAVRLPDNWLSVASQRLASDFLLETSTHYRDRSDEHKTLH